MMQKTKSHSIPPSDFSEEELMAIRRNAIRIYAYAKEMYEKGGGYRDELLPSDIRLPMFVANAYIEIVSKALPEIFGRNGFSASRLGDICRGDVCVYFAAPYDKSIQLPPEEEFIGAVNKLDINNLSNHCLDFARGRCLIAPSFDYKPRLLNPFGDNNSWAASANRGIEPASR